MIAVALNLTMVVNRYSLTWWHAGLQIIFSLGGLACLPVHSSSLPRFSSLLILKLVDGLPCPSCLGLISSSRLLFFKAFFRTCLCWKTYLHLLISKIFCKWSNSNKIFPLLNGTMFTLSMKAIVHVIWKPHLITQINRDWDRLQQNILKQRFYIIRNSESKHTMHSAGVVIPVQLEQFKKSFK